MESANCLRYQTCGDATSENENMDEGSCLDRCTFDLDMKTTSSTSTNDELMMDGYQVISVDGCFDSIFTTASPRTA